MTLRSLDIVGKYLLTAVLREPATMLAGAGIASGLVGTGLSASGTLAAGDYAARAGAMARTAAYARAGEQEDEAGQVEQNATGEIAAAQRQALEKRREAKLLTGSLQARAAGSGVDAGVGSPVVAAGEIAGRGEYQALMDMFQGQNVASGLRNKAAGMRYGAQITRYGGDIEAEEGQMRQRASRTSALATLAGGIGSAATSYGRFRYPGLRTS